MIFFIIIMSILFLLFSSIIMLISFILSTKMMMDREKSSPFECGFDPMSSSRIPFSLHFFLITVMFLIFDVEITLILPMIFSFPISNILNWSMLTICFIIILLIGLYHEWNQGMLNWL
uniref:NADH dehydrogenase subunit 3 n=1 Tax=Phthiridium szechuanum TaxID=2982585 RepID=UPI002238C11B|nr:NADH dehydrogenase subunit 3 [Phthiridium szechuanum]UYP50981.1 NADH dehydrogenase subunit 3 [Phthiridium szechuanum]